MQTSNSTRSSFTSHEGDSAKWSDINQGGERCDVKRRLCDGVGASNRRFGKLTISMVKNARRPISDGAIDCRSGGALALFLPRFTAKALT
jgi:hypothetical protein